MRILVLGGGVIGITSAYYLAKAGHSVTVVDRQPGAGMETSFANAGQVSPGYAAPWAAPGIPIKALKWLMMRHRPLVMWPRVEPRLYLWLASMLANCTEEAYERNKGRMLRLAEYSRDVLKALRSETGIVYDHRERGTLQVFRKQSQLDHVGADTDVLERYGVAHQVLDEAGCIAVEPALARVPGRVVGGLYLPGDETGDAHLFTQRLAALCVELGVEFRYGAAIKRILKEGQTVSGVELEQGAVLVADAYVAAMGSFTPALLKPLGLDLPVYPVKGYSLTMPIAAPDAAPVSTVMDETFKVGITRLGDRLRIGGTAELAGFSHTLRSPRRATLEQSVSDLFPDAGDLRGASFWTGLRPMTPDGTPIIGATAFGNLFTNTGHGTLGWTMACGSAKVLADLMSGKTPDIAADDLSLQRYATAP
ncbi:D-amino acid dehydrogenase [Beijerinckia sp. L45]|uniref:D-amino acid dehydrogenase n=1 Tax=Beijerinckia sp. L45 TaxID=1641855 RepID=UPI00131E6B3A|nr:D-amino acid dehydrogenase [Beijerinckia sp. L45]